MQVGHLHDNGVLVVYVSTVKRGAACLPACLPLQDNAKLAMFGILLHGMVASANHIARRCHLGLLQKQPNIALNWKLTAACHGSHYIMLYYSEFRFLFLFVSCLVTKHLGE